MVRVQGPDAEWTHAIADAVRDALAPYASGPLRTLARTRGAMATCCALPFVTIASLYATTTGVSWLDALPWIALAPFAYRIGSAERSEAAPRRTGDERYAQTQHTADHRSRMSPVHSGTVGPKENR